MSIVGVVFTASACALAVVALIGLRISPIPSWVSRSIAVLSLFLLALSLLLLAASTRTGYFYAMEVFISHYGASIYEPVGVPTSSSTRAAIALWLSGVSSFVPQFFWFRRYRSRPRLAFFVALAAVIPSAIARVLVSPVG
jgi:hypothetical protein